MKMCYQEYLKRAYANGSLSIEKAKPSDCLIIQGISLSLTVSRGSELSGFVEYPDPGIAIWRKRLEYSDSIFVLKKNLKYIGYVSLYPSEILNDELFPNDPIAQHIQSAYQDNTYLDQIGILSGYKNKGYGLLMAHFADNIICGRSTYGVAATIKRDTRSISEKILDELGWSIGETKTFNNGLPFNIYTKVFDYV